MFLVTMASAILFVTNAFAVEYNASLDAELNQVIQKGGFYKPENMPITPKNFARAAHATFRISPQEGTCSAVVLSNDGYVATALHCVEHCFHTKWNYQPPVVSVPKTHSDIYSGVQIPVQAPPEMNCPDMQGPNFWNYEFQIDNPTIVFVGRGMLTNNEKKMVAISDAEFDSIKDLEEDVAILKYKVKPGQVLPCVPAAKVMPAPNQPVWAVGFPVRGPGYDWDGYRKGTSVGRVRASMAEDLVLKQYASEINPQDVSRFWNYQTALWDRPDFLLTSADGAHGNSGGLMVDQNGDFVGVAFSITKGEDHYNGGSFVGFSAVRLREEATRFLGEEKSEEIFNCPSSTSVAARAVNESSL